MAVEITEEEIRLKSLVKDLRKRVWGLLEDLADTPDDPSIVPQLVQAVRSVRDNQHAVEALQAIRVHRSKEQSKHKHESQLRREEANRVKAEAKLLADKEASEQLKSAKVLSAKEQSALLVEQARTARLERLALEGRKKAIVQIALASGDLEEITEDRIQAVANAQRRSNGGVIRIESGSGK